MTMRRRPAGSSALKAVLGAAEAAGTALGSSGGGGSLFQVVEGASSRGDGGGEGRGGSGANPLNDVLMPLIQVRGVSGQAGSG